MSSVSRSAAVLVALFGSIPLFFVLSLILWELYSAVNGGVALNATQSFQVLFAGFSFALAAFAFIYSSMRYRA